MNYVFVVPVILAVGAFRSVLFCCEDLKLIMLSSLYHFYNLTNNTTTIERWEKDKAATLKRNGKIQEVGNLHLDVLQQFIPLSDQVSLCMCPKFTSQRSLTLG